MMDTATYKAVNRARVALTQGKKTFVIVDENKLLHYSEERGLYPLVNLIETEPSKLEGAVIGDRITGRAAALLCIAGNVKAVFSLIIADEAIRLLEKHDILTAWQETVPYIVERDLSSRYKMDILLKDVAEPWQAAGLIRQYLNTRPAEPE